MSELTDGLRELADWLDAHPDVPEPSVIVNAWFDEDTEFSKQVAAIGSGRKFAWDQYIGVTKMFGPIKADWTAYRSQVCEKRVVGTRHIEETVTPEHDEEIVEWDCPPSFLAAGETA